MSKIAIDLKHCKGCALCVEFCAPGSLRMSHSVSQLGVNPAEVADEESCTLCLNCTTMCPDAAIRICKD